MSGQFLALKNTLSIHVVLISIREHEMNDIINTRDHNMEVLHDLGFSQVRNTTVFQKREKFILSPAVAESSNGKYWFDVREVNLNRINDNSLLLVRIVPDLFILENLDSLSTLFSREVMDNRPNSGNVWGIHMDIQISKSKAFLFNVKQPKHKISTNLLNKLQLVKSYNEIT